MSFARELVPASRQLVAVSLATTAAVGALAVGAGVPVAGLFEVSLVAGVVAVVAWRPQLAAYVFVVTMPLLAGLGRGVAIPVLRPYEAVLLVVATGVAVRCLIDVVAGRFRLFVFSRVDGAVLLLVTFGSIVPLLHEYAVGTAFTRDDLLYSVMLWKYLVLFFMIRVAVRTGEQVRRCLVLSIAVVAVVAVVAVLQGLQLFGVPGLLAKYYTEGAAALSSDQRGMATLSSSIAVGDVMNLNLAIALALFAQAGMRSRWLAGAAALFVAGALASGQFSSAIGLVVTLAVVMALRPDVRRVAARTLPAVVVAGIAVWPVINTRLAGFSSPGGLPHSWQGRLDNLRDFFWPKLFEGHAYLLGVRPAARLPAYDSWRDWIYIESGHTYLLWVGGIPFLLAFCWYVYVALRATVGVARRRDDVIGAAGTAAVCGLGVMFVLMTFDAHLVLRGAADSLFVVLALSLVHDDGGLQPADARRGARPEHDRVA